jgi:hypothetical protein
VPNGLLKPVNSTWTTLLDLLGRPGAAVAGAVDASQNEQDILAAISSALKGGPKKNFGDVLSNSGMKEGWGRDLSGFALDVVADPINLIPGAALGKAAKLGGKGLGKINDGLAKIPVAGKVYDAALNSVTPYRELRHTPEAFQDAVKIRDLQTKSAKSIAMDQAVARSARSARRRKWLAVCSTRRLSATTTSRTR